DEQPLPIDSNPGIRRYVNRVAPTDHSYDQRANSQQSGMGRQTVCRSVRSTSKFVPTDSATYSDLARMTTSLKIILDDLADFHQMRRLRRDAQGVYTLVSDGRWVVNIESDALSGTVSIFGSAGQVRPALDRSPLLSELEWQRISDAELPFGGRVGVHFR